MSIHQVSLLFLTVSAIAHQAQGGQTVRNLVGSLTKATRTAGNEINRNLVKYLVVPGLSDLCPSILTTDDKASLAATFGQENGAIPLRAYSAKFLPIGGKEIVAKRVRGILHEELKSVEIKGARYSNTGAILDALKDACDINSAINSAEARRSRVAVADCTPYTIGCNTLGLKLKKIFVSY